jgi:hypothetical protein
VLQRGAGQELGVGVETHYILSRHKTGKVSKVVYGVEAKPKFACFPQAVELGALPNAA